MKNDIQKTIEGCFAGVIGQPLLKSKRIMDHTAFAMGSNEDHHLFVAGEPGLGKSHFLLADLAAHREAVAIRMEREASVEFIPSPQKFRTSGIEFTRFLDHIATGDGQSIDEIQEADQGGTKQTRMIKLIIKELCDAMQGPLRRVSLDGGDVEITRHHSEVFFSAGSSDPSKLRDFAAITSRLGGVKQLELYTVEQLQELLILKAKERGLRIVPETVGLMAKCGRGTARPLNDMVAHLVAVATISGKWTINRVEALEAMRALSLYPLGLNGTEVAIVCATRNGGIPTRLIPIRWKLDPKIARDSLSFLLSLGFIGRGSRGDTTLTSKGAAYLDQLKAERFTLPA
jgi:Holliday junction resolvasome RuvABC ATP-dependent DNA helicase subunit